ncbi:arginine deiminase [Ruminiclostridium cellobioparum]|uniref:Arginine deiminase n=1 Tax=Ruminiclostridium cellobioparum subsp. termitidis CT1112 TaxID=1195236 RepID=S0FGA7_RUMCE|nr:arginine deiminase [Ruminiclostridium cellobioparum]EMS70365.1 Arginine deiminase [Ruminiclostridium cellobioparum subsp. termitidis CT1112]
MSFKPGISVYSEIGKLKSVLLHRPGLEVENIVPDYLTKLLFDEIVYLDQAQREHEQFVQILRKEEVEVVYMTDLMTDILEDSHIREEFLMDFMIEGKVVTDGLQEAIKEYFSSLTPRDFINKCIAGTRHSDLKDIKHKTLGDMIKNAYPFYLDPIPNMYFQRDPFASIGKGISLNVMANETRNRETIFAKYIFNYHPRFKEVPRWYNRDKTHTIEGGDILVLSDKVVAIGVSARTSTIAVERVAQKLLESEEPFNTVLVFDIPKKRAYMHLDTVFTMVDYDQFTIFPGIEAPLDVYSISRAANNRLHIKYEHSDLSEILKKHLKLPAVNLIRCGDGDIIAASREQWSDGSNTLAVSPGKVVCYNRNHITNDALRKNSIEVLEFDSYELSRGRGGPRCMSMPLYRDNPYKQ